MLGFVLPLASAIAHSVSLLDLAVWGGIALLIQLSAFALLHLLLRDLPAQIEQDHLAMALMVALASVVVGLIAAAAMS